MHSANRTDLNGGEPIDTSGMWTVTFEYYPPGAANGQPVGFFCSLNQVLHAFVTMFFVEPAPSAEWTATAPDA